MVWRVLSGWGLFSALCLSAVVFGDLGQFALNAVVSLHSAVTILSSVLIVGLMGIDATASQIIPAWKK